MSATLDSIAADLADIKAKLAENFPDTKQQQTLQDDQQRIQMLSQERFMIQQLQREGFSKEDAITYYERMLKGEKPWREHGAK
jgi:hypothetical protein